MPDKLKKYLQENLDDLNNLEPIREDAIWMDIDQKLNPPKRTNWLLPFILVSVALIGTVAFFMMRSEVEPVDEPLSAPIIAQLNDLTKEYQLKVMEKLETIDMAGLKDARFDELLSELDEINIRQMNLTEEIKKFGINDKLIEGMIKYHERKLRILELLSKEKEYQKLENSKIHEI